MPKGTDLTDYAVQGYEGQENTNLATSACWYAHCLGKYLNDSGRCKPRDVRMARGDSIRSGDLRFAFRQAGGKLEFERIE